MKLKQHSLTSSDENVHNSKTKSTEYLRDEEEDEEENNFDDMDMDEEIRSTTEYTTNDEMDLESGSVSASANNLQKEAGNEAVPPAPTFNSTSTLDSKTIDDYLNQNLKKEDILAAKMTKFLSVSTSSLLSLFYLSACFSCC